MTACLNALCIAATVRNLTDIKEWIKQFPTLKVTKWEEIEAAKSPNGKLYIRFMTKIRRLPRNQRKLRLAFRGTEARFIHNICQNGYNSPLMPSKSIKKRGRKARAKKFMYFATNPDAAKEHCCDEHKIIVNELLLHGQDGQVNYLLTKDQNVIGLNNPYYYALPRFIITYE